MKHWTTFLTEMGDTSISDRLGQRHQDAIGPVLELVTNFHDQAKQLDGNGLNPQAYREWLVFMKALERIRGVLGMEQNSPSDDPWRNRRNNPTGGGTKV